jgi:8-oxo-dGTP pyrophosphatase MutT (NUDIX family)
MNDPRPASTLILLRDAAGGPEVLMLKRHGLSDVLGGAFVFPGGKVDEDDARLDVAAHLDATAEALHARLGEPGIGTATAAGLYVAALRETFEEAGVLLGHGLAPAACADASARLRAGVSFNALLAEFGLRLAVNALLPWSRWITPERSLNKRFDTRFFVARLPEESIACHDGHETVQSAWLRPRTALEIYWDGGMTLAPPQIMTLAALARHGVSSFSVQ